jgi:hypothetical protein
MPYFVFAVRPFAQPAKLGEHAAFRDASAQAKTLRAAPDADPRTAIRVMLAADPTAAEDLLLQLRERAPEPDD